MCGVCGISRRNTMNRSSYSGLGKQNHTSPSNDHWTIFTWPLAIAVAEGREWIGLVSRGRWGERLKRLFVATANKLPTQSQCGPLLQYVGLAFTGFSLTPYKPTREKNQMLQNPGVQIGYTIHLSGDTSALSQIAESDCQLRVVCPSIRMELLASHRTDFYEIWYLLVFRKSVHKIQVSLKPDKNNGYFTWRPIYIYSNISLNSPQNENCFRQKL
jgi:hypothetical protein